MKKWKEASSLIITAAAHVNPSFRTDSVYLELEKSNFLLLALKKKSESFPKACVFPGGSVSSADSSSEWINLFEGFNCMLESFTSCAQNESLKLPIFENIKDEIPRWLSLRITAIRETFEESGLLICKSSSNLKNEPLAEHFQINSVDLWRSKVIENPYQFISLCKEFKCYPNIDVLHPWSNWLSPSNNPKRFDAIFFITTLKKIENLTPDNLEIECVEWCSPEKLLDSSDQGEIWFLPPQYYEITRLKNISKLEEVKQFANYRTTLEYSRWMPVRISAKNGDISLLPGDEMYPRALDLYKPECLQSKDILMEDLRCSKMHRFEHRGFNLKLLVQNMKGDTRIPDFICSKI